MSKLLIPKLEESKNSDVKDELKIEQEKNQNLEKMFSSVVHEFRTPINAFCNATTMLKFNIDSLRSMIIELDIDDKEINEELEHIWRSSEKFLKTWHISSTMMTNLTDDILDLSKIEAGVFSLNEQPFQLRGLVEEITYIFEGQWNQKGIYFEFVWEQDILDQFFCSDICRIKQILLNLISNSVKFTSAGGITVSVSLGRITDEKGKPKRKLYFSVKDTGIGISKEDWNNLFTLYGTVSNEESKR